MMQRIWAVVLLAVIGLTGCPSAPVPPVPIPPPLVVPIDFSWVSDGNPWYKVCSPTQMPPCKVNYVIRDETLNHDLVTLPMIQSTATWMIAAPHYTLPVATASLTHQFSLRISIQSSTAAIVASPKDFAYITLK
jgi:hypothetical protein